MKLLLPIFALLISTTFTDAQEVDERAAFNVVARISPTLAIHRLASLDQVLGKINHRPT
jgi:hypothetical protein